MVDIAKISTGEITYISPIDPHVHFRWNEYGYEYFRKKDIRFFRFFSRPIPFLQKSHRVNEDWSS